MPYTTTFGYDIAPTYGINFSREWFIFAIDEDTNQQPLERVYSIAELTSVQEAYILEDKLRDKFGEFNIEINMIALPPKIHLDIILNHHRYKKYQLEN